MIKTKIGAHISSQGGFLEVPLRAKKWKCECYMFFTRSPQGGKAPEIGEKDAQKFKALNKKFKFDSVYVHAPYFINLASINNKIYYGSIGALKEELKRCSVLAVTALMTHIGSAAGTDRKKALVRVSEAIIEILIGYKGSTRFLLEVSAGAGEIIGSDLEELGKIIGEAEKKIGRGKIGICLDTAHLFASGYDLRTPKDVSKLSGDIKRYLGWARVGLVHSNDSKVDLGERKDRHEHIGKGKIGIEGFRAIMSNSNFGKLNFILETPEPEERAKDIVMLKRLRSDIMKNIK